MDYDDLLKHRLPKTPEEAACLQINLLKAILREVHALNLYKERV